MGSYMLSKLLLVSLRICLNPCCDGRWSRTGAPGVCNVAVGLVLILVVMEDGLVLMVIDVEAPDGTKVLILVVVDNGLVPVSSCS